MPKYTTGYRKYSYALEQKFRMQLLCTNGKWWLRLRFYPSKDVVEIDMSETFSPHKFLKEAKMLGYWCYYRRKPECPYTAQVFEESDICSRLYKVWYTHQQLFKYEEDEDIYLSVLVKLTSREPTEIWENYERGNKSNSRYQYWD